MDYVQMHPMVQILHCAVQTLSHHWNNPNYAAPYWRLYWNPTPGARVELHGVRTALDPAQIIVIPPDTPYAAHLDRPAEHLYIHFLAQGRYRAAAPSIYAFKVTATTRELLDEIRARPADPARERLLALTLAHLALTQLPAVALPASPGDERIRGVMAHLDQHFATAQPNAQLARMAGMNTNAFIRLFRETAGETPQHYLRRRRIEAACVALHYSTRSIDEIAADCGFCDRFHFTKVFQHQRRIAPAQFRKTRDRKPNE